jgi:hypothetical protein
MRHNKRERRAAKAKDIPLVRASIGFPPNVYEILEEIAREKKVSLAWVVRDSRKIHNRNSTDTGKSRSDTL